MGYATMLERHGRARDALDVLNRFAGDWSYRSPPLQLKLSLMRALGMDTLAEEEAAKRRSDSDLVRTRLDSPPMSAIPVERNPLAQAAFGRTIEVVGNAWIEPAAEASPGPGRLVYRRASGPDPAAFARSIALEPGQRLLPWPISAHPAAAWESAIPATISRTARGVPAEPTRACSASWTNERRSRRP